MLLTACGEHMRFPVTRSAQENLPPNLEVIQVTEKNIDHVVSLYHRPRMEYGGNPPASPARHVYRVGPGDQLRVQVWSTPERTASAEERSLQPLEGPVVDEPGTFFSPFVGEVRAAGRTVREIRTDLTEKLSAYLRDPQVEVAVETFRAHQVMAIGAVGSPGPVTITNVPLRLVDLLNQTSTTATSDLSRVELRRRGQQFIVNARLFLERGDMRHNPLLRPGDTVFVPELTDNVVYVFGEISTTRLALTRTDKSLTEVLAQLGGIDRQRANARGVFVFRRTDVTTEGFDVVFQFDLTNAATLVMMKSFPVMPQDIIFVTKDPITRWTDTVGRVLAPAAGFLQVRSVVNTVSDE
jgi:polysaccharide export outer membrane protein